MPYLDIFKHGHWKAGLNTFLGLNRKFSDGLGAPLAVGEDSIMRDILLGIPLPVGTVLIGEEVVEMSNMCFLIRPCSPNNSTPSEERGEDDRIVVRLDEINYEIFALNSDMMADELRKMDDDSDDDNMLSQCMLSMPAIGLGVNTELESFHALGLILQKPYSEKTLLMKAIQNDLRVAIPALSAPRGTLWVLKWFEVMFCPCCCKDNGGLLGYQCCACPSCGCESQQPFLLFKVLDGTNQRTDGQLRIKVLRNEIGAEENPHYSCPLETSYFEAVVGHDAQYLVHSRIFYRVESHQCSSREARKVRLNTKEPRDFCP
jgi:hypothetical protein